MSLDKSYLLTCALHRIMVAMHQTDFVYEFACEKYAETSIFASCSPKDATTLRWEALSSTDEYACLRFSCCTAITAYISVRLKYIAAVASMFFLLTLFVVTAAYQLYRRNEVKSAAERERVREQAQQSVFKIGPELDASGLKERVLADRRARWSLLAIIFTVVGLVAVMPVSMERIGSGYLQRIETVFQEPNLYLVLPQPPPIPDGCNRTLPVDLGPCAACNFSIVVTTQSATLFQ